MSQSNTLGQTKPEISTALYPHNQGFKPQKHAPVGGVLLSTEPIEYNNDRKTVQLTVRHTGDRPIQVGSHFHFFEVNRFLKFDREAAYGYHLNIPATSAIRFEPGDERQVELVAFAGKRRIIGFNGLVNGYTGEEDEPTYYPQRRHAIDKMRHYGFMTEDSEKVESPKKQK